MFSALLSSGPSENVMCILYPISAVTSHENIQIWAGSKTLENLMSCIGLTAWSNNHCEPPCECVLCLALHPFCCIFTSLCFLGLFITTSFKIVPKILVKSYWVSSILEDSNFVVVNKAKKLHNVTSPSAPTVYNFSLPFPSLGNSHLMDSLTWLPFHFLAANCLSGKMSLTGTCPQVVFCPLHTDRLSPDLLGT